MLFAGQFVVGKIPVLDSVWDVVHPVPAAIVAAVALAAGIAVFALLASRIRRAWRRRREARLERSLAPVRALRW